MKEQHWVYPITRKFDSHWAKHFSIKGLYKCEKKDYFLYDKENTNFGDICDICPEISFVYNDKGFYDVMSFCEINGEDKYENPIFALVDKSPQKKIEIIEKIVHTLIEKEYEFKKWIKNLYSDFLTFFCKHNKWKYYFYESELKLYHHTTEEISYYPCDIVESITSLEELKRIAPHTYTITHTREIRFDDETIINAQYDELMNFLISELKNCLSK